VWRRIQIHVRDIEEPGLVELFRLAATALGWPHLLRPPHDAIALRTNLEYELHLGQQPGIRMVGAQCGRVLL
jgi:hypothetical protein